MEPIKFEENKRKGQFKRVLCEECQVETRHLIVSSYDCTEYDYLEDYDCSLEFLASFQIIQCQGCMSVSFRKTEWSSELPSHDDEEREHLYPERTHLTHFIKSFQHFPEQLKAIYEQTIDCYNHHHFILAAVGLRALLEGICASLGVLDGPARNKKGEAIRSDKLSAKISGLSERGFLTKESAETLHEHRYLGNYAVHELKSPSRGELDLAIKIIEHVIRDVFEIPHIGEELKKKRLNRKK